MMRVGVVCLLLLVPSVAGQLDNPEDSTPTTLYFHIFDTFNLFPINTQPLEQGFFQVVGTNFPTLPENDVQQHDYNTIYGFSSAGPVEYDFIENGRPRYHPERGIARDVQIDDAVQPTAYFYIDVRDVFGNDDAPMMLPDLTVRVTMRTGDDIGPSSTLDEGQLIMDGELTAHVVDGHGLTAVEDAASTVPWPDHPVLRPDESGVVEFAVPMAIHDAGIPKSEAFNIRIDWYQAPEAAGEDGASMGWLRPVLDEAHLPRLELNIMDPVYIDFIHPQVTAGTLLVHSGVNSPWGTYDIDVEDMELDITGPAQPQEVRRVVAQNVHVHGRHDDAAEITYLWDFRSEEAPDGEYTITLRVPNLAGNAVAVGEAQFRVEGTRAYGIADSGEVVESRDDEKGKESPLPVWWLAGLLVLARRRHT